MDWFAADGSSPNYGVGGATISSPKQPDMSHMVSFAGDVLAPFTEGHSPDEEHIAHGLGSGDASDPSPRQQIDSYSRDRSPSHLVNPWDASGMGDSTLIGASKGMPVGTYGSYDETQSYQVRCLVV
jgi:hypothetical protein